MISSKNLKASTELTLIANIKPGLVDLPDPMSYATRLTKLLGTLFESRKLGIETGAILAGPLERLRTIHFVRWAVLDGGRRLLLGVSFDRPWEPYIREIVDEAGPILDVIFSHCEGYEQHSARDGYERFAEWVRAGQRACDFWFAAFPGLSVDDIHYLKRLKYNLDCGRDPQALPLEVQVDDHVLDPEKARDFEFYSLFFITAVGLYRLRSYFPVNPEPDPEETDRAVFDRSCSAILRGFLGPKEATPPLPEAFKQQYDGIGDFYANALSAPAPAVLPAVGAVPPDVQGGIVTSYRDGDKPLTHGCVVLLEVGADPRGLLDFVDSHLDASDGQTRYNVAFTPHGLEKIGQAGRTLNGFPPEFVEGMEARSGLLGDVGTNHPLKWRLPRQNHPEPSDTTVPLSSVDAVVIMQKRAGDVAGDHAWGATHPLWPEVRELEKYCAAVSEDCATVLHVQTLRRYNRWVNPDTGRDEARYQDGTAREHFGYLDGFSQPKLDVPGATGVNDIAYGEMFVGQPNDRGDSSDPDPVLKNGTFMALRKLSQDVEAFRTFLADRPELATKLATKMMGRDPDGVPATSPAAAGRNDFNYQDDKSGLGCPLQAHVRLANPRRPLAQSVFGRPMRTPRITRRGFSYGPLFAGRADADPKAERGVVFMALGASLAQQYEVIQRWLNGANATGLDSSQRCPISAPVETAGNSRFHWRDANGPVMTNMKQFVRLEWGVYLFLPTRDGLKALKTQATERLTAARNHQPDAKTRQIMAAGQQALAGLMQSTKVEDWRQALEEQGSREPSFAILTAIRLNHRVLRTPEGVIVTGAKEAREVLTNEETYSVREYFRRMQGSRMPMYLGMDRVPVAKAVCPVQPDGQRLDQAYVASIGNDVDYARESVANELLYGLTREDGFRLALRQMRDVRSAAFGAAQSAARHIAQLANGSIPTPRAPRALLDLFKATEFIISQLSQHWFGMPDGKLMRHGGQPNTEADTLSYCPADFLVFSQYVFRPSPDKPTERWAAARGERVTTATLTFVRGARQSDGSYGHPFLEDLRRRADPSLDRDGLEAWLTRAVVGSVDGFAGANFGSFLSVVGQWLAMDEFIHVQRSYRAEIAALGRLVDADGAYTAGPDPLLSSSKLLSFVAKKMQINPKPAWLHRTALRDTVLGNVAIKAGDPVLVHLGQASFDGAPDDGSTDTRATNDRMTYDLFGGQYAVATKGIPGPTRTPQHACPGKEVALGVLLGMVVGTLELKNVTQEATLTVAFDP